MAKFNKLVGTGKKVGKARIGREGEAKITAGFRVRASVVEAFSQEIARRIAEGEELHKGEVVEMLMEKWIKGECDER